MVKAKDLVKAGELFITIENDTVFCFLEEKSLDGEFNGLDYTIAVNFSVCENSVIDWRVSHPDFIKYFKSIIPKFKIYNIKKVKIKDVFDDDDIDDFWFNVYANKKGNEFFLILNTENTECIKNITNMKNGDKMEFKLKGNYYILSFTVKLIF